MIDIIQRIILEKKEQLSQLENKLGDNKECSNYFKNTDPYIIFQKAQSLNITPYHIKARSKVIIAAQLIKEKISIIKEDIITLEKILNDYSNTDNPNNNVKNYPILEFFNSPATLEELEASYKQYRIEYHPDGGSDPNIVSSIAKIYEFLKDSWEEIIDPTPELEETLKEKTLPDILLNLPPKNEERKIDNPWDD